MKLRRKATLAVAAIAALGIAPAAASAQGLAVYPEDTEARTFATGNGGWTSSTSTEGLCLLTPVLCPDVTNSFEASGGADGATDGYIDTDFNALAGALGATSKGIWESPAFTYNGVNGQPADLLGFVVHRRADVGQLLGLLQDQTYSVEILDLTEPSGSLLVIDEETLGGASGWTQVGPIPLAANALEVGHEYKVRITSTFNTGLATLLITGGADWDNVGIAAIKGGGVPDPGGPGGDPNYNQDPGGGGGGGGGGNDDRGAGPGNSGVKGAAVLQGNKLLVNARCNRNVRTGCDVKLVGLLKKKGPKATKGARAQVDAGRKRRVALKVKAKHASKLQNRKKIWVKQTVRANGKKRKSVVKLKIKRA